MNSNAMDEKLSCAIIDDEPLARECIEGYANAVGFLRPVATGNNPVELSHHLDTQAIDLVFLDIQMPLMNGLEYLRTNPRTPMVIITTAYPHYALEGFRFDVLDYLVKPITFDRFFKAATKAKTQHALHSGSQPKPDDHFFIKCDSKYERIFYRDIRYIQGMQNYVALYTDKGKYLTLLSMKSVEDKLDMQGFVRAHKSYIVSIPKIESIDNNEIVMGTTRIPISRHYHDEVMTRVVSDKLWRK